MSSGSSARDFEALLQQVAAAPDLGRAPDLVGAELGPFRIQEELGKGGMGVVYRAQDTRLQRDVAVKVLSSRWAGTQGKTRLLDEARSAAQLNHPHIATIHEIAEHDGVELVAMELAPGGTLAGARLRGRALREALLDVALALEHAHERGVVHRDLKPDNLARGESGRVIVLDFGLASRRDGEIAGTPGYMPREQAEGQESGPRADVYAFGRTALELALGELPDVRAQERALDRLPRDLKPLVQECLNDRPQLRPQNGSKLVKALQTRSRRGLMMVGAALVGVAIAMAFMMPEPAPGPPSVESVPTLNLDARTEAKFRAGVEAFYAADLEGARRQLAKLSAPKARGLLLLLATIERDEGEVARQRAALAGQPGWPGQIAAQTELTPSPEAGWFERLMLTSFTQGPDRIERLRALIKEDPVPAITHWFLASAHQRAHQDQEAEEAARFGLQFNPESFVLLRTLAEIEVNRDPKAALVQLQALVKRRPSDPYVRFMRVEAWDLIGDRDRSLRELERLLDEENGFEPLVAARGVLASLRAWPARGEAKRAVPLTERAVEILVECGAWEAVASWLPRLWDEATLRGDVDEATLWLQLVKEHRDRHPDLDAVLRLQAGELVETQLPEASRVAARMRFARETNATNEVALRSLYEPDVAALLIAKSVESRKDTLLKGLVARANACAQKTLWWEHACRPAIAEAALRLNDTEALNRVWPNPDPEALAALKRTAGPRTAP